MPNIEADPRRVHVAVGVIQNAHGDILIAKRANHLHAGGLWEFPGGKVEVGETVEAALRRELREELAIEIKTAKPFIRVRHDYPEKKVLLDVWRVDVFEGMARGLQNQPLQWVPVAELVRYEFPKANERIVSALQLPQAMMITGDFFNRDDFGFRLNRALECGVSWVQLRAHVSSVSEYRELFFLASDLCEKHTHGKNKITLVVNTSIEIFNSLPAQGLHLTSERLMACQQHPVEKGIILGASCHNLAEIRQAEKLNADYITLGPVFKTPSHPDALPLELENFSALAKQTDIPVFALGGMTRECFPSVVSHGGLGMAGITFGWPL